MEAFPRHTPRSTQEIRCPRSLPSSFRWTSSGPLIGPKNDGRGIAGIKDPSVVYHNGRYHVFASTARSAGYNLVYTSFADWNQAASAPFTSLDQTPIGAGYRAAPQVFYCAPQRLWYLVYQIGNASYSTIPDIGNPNGWSAPRHFYSGTPQIIQDNIGNGYRVDMWVICDAANCHLFSSDDNGHLYRSQTSFARAGNVTFSGSAWTRDISHGEMIRSGIDQNLDVSPCGLRYLYQGLDPAAGGDYNALPWRLGLLTQTNSSC